MLARLRSVREFFSSKHNWFLRIGGSLALMAVFLAVFGPWLAPHDPLQENYIAEVGGRYFQPPFAPGRVPAFPLGSDEFGRDILSRLLWGVRPTLLLVTVVAALRLAIGIVIGLVAGWTAGRFSRYLDGLITGFLSVPVLLVALCVVASLAQKWGLGAFILGLTITGWADAARLVQVQTRSVKGQHFIEASRSMGANDGQIILSHVLSHILPLMLIQIAFEISAVLLAVAALGFLGYFINAVYIPIGDFYGVRASRMPELGQMLGISLRSMPWLATSAGSLVFLLILAFNFLGEGLRMAMSPEQLRKQRSRQVDSAQSGSWLGERAYLAVTEWRRTAFTGATFGALFFIVFGGGWLLWRTQSAQIPPTKLTIPGEHVWAADRHDAQGSYWAAGPGPREAVISWRFYNPDGLVGGPAIDQDGNLYLTAKGRALICLDSKGVERWRAELPADPIGSPALNKDGRVIVATETGQLVAFNPKGKRIWLYESDPPDLGLTSPVVGKSKQGLIYYAVRDFLVAVTPAGKRAWQISLPTYSFVSPIPRVSPNGTYLFFEDTVIEAESGRRVRMEQTNPYDRYVSGANGLMYLYDEIGFKNWLPSPEGDRMIQTAKLDFRALNLSFRFAVDAGVAPSSDLWMLFGSGREFPRLVWASPGGQSMNVVDIPYRPWRMIGFDSQGRTYFCGILSGKGPECRAVQPDTSSILWKLALDEGRIPVGGALADRVMYVTFAEGVLYAIGP